MGHCVSEDLNVSSQSGTMWWRLTWMMGCWGNKVLVDLEDVPLLSRICDSSFMIAQVTSETMCWGSNSISRVQVEQCPYLSLEMFRLFDLRSYNGRNSMNMQLFKMLLYIWLAGLNNVHPPSRTFRVWLEEMFIFRVGQCPCFTWEYTGSGLYIWLDEPDMYCVWVDFTLAWYSKYLASWKFQVTWLVQV